MFSPLPPGEGQGVRAGLSADFSCGAILFIFPTSPLPPLACESMGEGQGALVHSVVDFFFCASNITGFACFRLISKGRSRVGRR